MPADSRQRRATILFCLLVLAAGLLAFAPLRHSGFVNFDDPGYVTDNPIVLRGITAAGLRWAFAAPQDANYIPLTWLSHMLDCQLFGANPLGHHLVNLALHLLTAIGLFLMLARMTGRAMLSALVAVLFAVHPAHVESVAWIAERKDVLSGLFFVLTIAAYAKYVEQPRPGRYALVGLTMAAGLLCKPMLVTLPCVLLLLDVWPLGRTSMARPARQDEFVAPHRRTWGYLAMEKTPLLILALAAGGVTLLAQHSAGAMDGGSIAVPLWGRAGHAAVAYARYLGESFWPANLCVFYPRQSWAAWQIAVSVGLLIVITLGALSVRRRNPYLLVGWLMFVGMLVPVIGLVQVGSQSMADRYLYLPMIGLSIALIWSLADALKRRLQMPIWRAGASAACAILIAACILASRAQAGVWRNDLTLYAQCLKVAPDNAFVEQNLASALLQRGRTAEALEHFQKAVEIQPDLPDSRGGYAQALRLAGRFNDAERQLRIALDMDPRDPRLHAELGLALFGQHQWAPAAKQFSIALRARPDLPEIDLKLGLALLSCGRSPEAIEPLINAVTLMPNSPQALVALSWVLSTHPDAHLRNGAQALELARRADLLTGSSSFDVLDALAAAQAEQREYDQAAQTARRAAELAHKAGATTRASALDARARQYERHIPLRDPSLASVDAGE